jgi:hypothetical protein
MILRQARRPGILLSLGILMLLRPRRLSVAELGVPRGIDHRVRPGRTRRLGGVAASSRGILRRTCFKPDKGNVHRRHPGAW